MILVALDWGYLWISTDYSIVINEKLPFLLDFKSRFKDALQF